MLPSKVRRTTNSLNLQLQPAVNLRRWLRELNLGHCKATVVVATAEEDLQAVGISAFGSFVNVSSATELHKL